METAEPVKDVAVPDHTPLKQGVNESSINSLFGSPAGTSKKWDAPPGASASEFSWQPPNPFGNTPPWLMRNYKTWLWSFLLLAAAAPAAFGGEADIKIPPLEDVYFTILGAKVPGMAILLFGLVICALGAAFGLVQYRQTKRLPVHERMRQVSNTI